MLPGCRNLQYTFIYRICKNRIEYLLNKPCLKSLNTITSDFEDLMFFDISLHKFDEIVYCLSYQF